MLGSLLQRGLAMVSVYALALQRAVAAIRGTVKGYISFESCPAAAYEFLCSCKLPALGA